MRGGTENDFQAKCFMMRKDSVNIDKIIASAIFGRSSFTFGLSRRSSRKTKRMKRAAEKPNLVYDVSALNEEILEAADKIDGESLAPEVSTRTAEMTVWDESPEDIGWRVHERPMENQVTIAQQLVSEGNEQADREQRMAAGASDTAVAP
jgi:hypothetical protein